MSIRITWTDPNGSLTQEEEVRIYRSTSYFDEDSMPTVHAVLAANTLVYEDTAALPNVPYWYAVGFVKDGREALAFTSYVYVNGSLYTAPVTFGAGIIALTGLSITGSLFNNNAVFYSGTVIPPDIPISGSLFQSVATFGAGTIMLSGGVFTVTVPSGKVSSDLTNFPLMIDLSGMPSGFWSAVRSDGGNVRAYAADGVTMLPHDVTYINKSRNIGRMFVKTNLAAASDTAVKIKLLSSGTTALAVTDTNGRNAVWSDYEVVWVFPQTVNRTGKTYTQNSSSLLAHSEWIRTDYDLLTGAPHNGISTDGTHFISCDDIVLRRMNMSYVVQQTVTNINTALSAMTGLSNFDHMGDPVCVGTSTFFTVTTSDTTYRRFLVEYRTSDLTLLNAWEMTGAQRVFGGTVCYDGTHLLLFSYTDGTKFIKYTTAGVYVGDVTLTPSRAGIQGSTVLPSGNILISYDPGTIREITPAGADVGQAYTDPHVNIMEGLEYRDGTLWLLKGNGALITLRNDVHQDFRKLHGGNTMTAILNPTSQVWTTANSVYWTTTDVQQNFLGVDDHDNPVNTRGAGLLYDEGPDQIGTWNSTDLWLYVSPTLRPVGYETFRVAYGHNGSTERKVRARKGATNYSNVDSAISARPLGTNLRFTINSSGGEAYYQYSWLRYAYLSDAWLQADMDNMMNPTGFYTIT